jgi:pyruvate dehydrogenase E2 component (dihydrolipoamide acetyltransferase)
MAGQVKLPDLGEGIESAEVISVLVKEGDTIAVDDPIVEIETDKAAVEVPSTDAGRVAKVHVKEGDSIRPGTVLITLNGEEGQAAAEAQEQEKKLAGKTPQPPPQEEDRDQQTARQKAGEAPPAAEAPSRAGEPEPAAAPKAPAPTPPPRPAEAEPPLREQIVPAGPAVRRYARQLGIDIRRVEGSGPGGRITRQDVEAAVRRATRPAPSAAAPSEAPAAGHAEEAADTWGSIRREPLSRVRKIIARRMHESASTIPHVTSFDDADVTELEQFRQEHKEELAEAGVKLTMLAFVLKAVAQALKEHPKLNASLDAEGGEIIYKQYVHLGVAVDTDRGLLVPVLRSADEMRIADIARALGEAVARARSGRIAPDELRGGTFTVSNMGAIGGSYSTPIINPPESAILLLGRTHERPVVVEGRVAPRLLLPLSLSYDHRLIDGADAARFLNAVIGYLESPGKLLLTL